MWYLSRDLREVERTRLVNVEISNAKVLNETDWQDQRTDDGGLSNGGRSQLADMIVKVGPRGCAVDWMLGGTEGGSWVTACFRP